MRLRSIVFASGLALLIGAPLRAATVTVTIQSFSYSPDPVTITAGDTVHWVWIAVPPVVNHSTTSDPSSTEVWDSGLVPPPTTFDHTFPTAGSFGYHCLAHGGPGTGMFSTVIVNAASPIQLQSFDAE